MWLWLHWPSQKYQKIYFFPVISVLYCSRYTVTDEIVTHTCLRQHQDFFFRFKMLSRAETIQWNRLYRLILKWERLPFIALILCSMSYANINVGAAPIHCCLVPIVDLMHVSCQHSLELLVYIFHKFVFSCVLCFCIQPLHEMVLYYHLNTRWGCSPYFD